MSYETQRTEPSGDDSMPPEALRREALYTALVDVRNTELAVYWTRYNIQSAINFGLLAAVLASNSDSFIRKYIEFTAPAGFLLALIWLLFLVKGKQLLTGRWERHIRNYEKNTPEVKYRLFCEIENEKGIKTKWRTMWDNLDVLSRGLPILCMVSWIVIFIYHLGGQERSVAMTNPDTWYVVPAWWVHPGPAPLRRRQCRADGHLTQLVRQCWLFRA